MNIPTKVWTINPKDRSVVELYGVLDPNTRDWTDGLLSSIFRLINKPSDKNERKYILFDGDVDALWVENMNSVMDDNRLLTLANGTNTNEFLVYVAQYNLDGTLISAKLMNVINQSTVGFKLLQHHILICNYYPELK